MLTYRLSGTTEGTGVDHDEPHQYPPTPSTAATASTAQSSRTKVRLEDGAGTLTCGNATLPFRPEAACAPCSPSVRCQAVATSALSGPSYSASGSLARTRSGWRARAWASCSLAALVSASVGWKNTGPWEAAKMARS